MLTADLNSYCSDVVVITETTSKPNTQPVLQTFQGIVRSGDSCGRKGGGVAVYVRSFMQSSAAGNRLYLRAALDPCRCYICWQSIPPTTTAILHRVTGAVYLDACVQELINSFQRNTSYSPAIFTSCLTTM